MFGGKWGGGGEGGGTGSRCELCKCSDTNLDGDSVREELAEGGITHTAAAVTAVTATASSTASLPPPFLPPYSLLLTLRQELILFAAFFKEVSGLT